MHREQLAGAAYLLGKIYIILKRSYHVMIYTGHRPYTLTDKLFVDGMIAVDIATSYDEICVYVLDDGNGRVSRIGQDHSISTAVDGLKRGNLLSMSVTMDGRLTIVNKHSVVFTYGKDGTLLKVVSNGPLEYITHAVEVASDTLVVCNGSAIAKTTNKGNLLEQSTTPCVYVSTDREGNLIVCDRSKHQVTKLDSESFHETVTLLTLDRDGVENPQHVQYVLENGMVLVSWMNFLDVYSFTPTDTQGYLASSEHDTRVQQTSEAEMLEREIAHTNDAFKDLVNLYRRLGMSHRIFRDLSPDPQESQLPAASSLCECILCRVFWEPPPIGGVKRKRGIKIQRF